MYLKSLTITILLATIGYCHELCDVVDGVAKCREGFVFPLDVDKTIKKLVINSKILKSITKDDLKDYTELEEIDFSNCDIENIDPEAFTNNEVLKLLILSHNKNLKIPINVPMFISKSVVKLVLEETGITALGENVFSEMPNLTTIDLGENKIEDIQAALEPVANLETLLIMKGDNINLDLLCQRTSVRSILLKYYDEENNEKLDKYSCDQEQDIIDPTAKINQSMEEETTNKEHEEKETEKPVDHSEYCKDSKNLDFDGEIKCTEEEDGNTCDLTCPEGTKPETVITNPYKCMYDTGKFVPETVPKCIKLEPLKEDEDHKELNKIDAINNENEQTTEHKIEDDKPKDETEINQIETDSINQETGMKPKTNEAMMDNTIENGEEKVGESTVDKGMNGSTVVLGIIVVIIVIGAVGMGYKYWQNRKTTRYHNTRTEDVEEGKEMQTIVNKNTTQPLVEQNNQS